MIRGLLDGRTADPCMGIPHFLGSGGGAHVDLRCAFMLDTSGNLEGAAVQVQVLKQGPLRHFAMSMMTVLPCDWDIFLSTGLLLPCSHCMELMVELYSSSS